jgi:hypothetical protein
MDMGLFGTSHGGINLGYNQSQWSYNHPAYRHLLEEAREEERMVKALTTGSAIVTDGATGGQALRRQFLFGELDMFGPQQSDAKLVKLCPMKDAESTLLEWSLQGYTSSGDGFVGESGSDGVLGVDFYDDPLERLTETMGFLAEGRIISEVSKHVNSLMDPKKMARRGMLISMFAKANNAGYFGDRSKSNTQFNGMVAQIRNWADRHPEDYGVMYDCQNKPVDRYLLQGACNQNGNRFGEGDLLLQSTYGKSDTTQLIWPENRNQEGRGGNFGGQFNIFDGPNGPVRLESDKMLRIAQPVKIDGVGKDGAPRTTATLDTGSLAWSGTTPFVTNAAAAAGAGNFWTYFNKNTDSTTLGTAPALPSGSSAADGGNNTNNLAAGTYYYAVSHVYKGFEAAAYILGAGTQAANTISGTPTAITLTAGQITNMVLDPTQITGLGSTYARNLIKFRVYRYGGPGAAAPTQLSQFQFLGETGIPIASNARFYDNGFGIPGTDNAFLITTKKNGEDEWCFANLLPLMQKELPVLAMGDQFCILWFTMMLLRNRRRHVWLRNIGRAS